MFFVGYALFWLSCNNTLVKLMEHKTWYLVVVPFVALVQCYYASNQGADLLSLSSFSLAYSKAETFFI